MSDDEISPPAGFTLDAPAAPAPPPGFTLDAKEAPKPPAGFKVDAAKPPEAEAKQTRDQLEKPSLGGIGALAGAQERIYGAAGEGLKEGFGEGPLGFSKETLETPMMKTLMGTPEGRTLMQRLNQAVIGGPVGAGDLLMRSMNS